jgi:hypothetical protein
MGKDPVKAIAGVMLFLWALGWVLMLIFLRPPNTGEFEYETHCNRQELLELHGKKVLLLAFEYDPGLLVNTDRTMSFDTYQPAVVENVSALEKKVYLSVMGSYFEVSDVSDQPAVLRGRMPGGESAADLSRQIIQEQGAEGAVLVTNGYGYMQQLGLLETLLQYVLPDTVLKPATVRTDSPVYEVHLSASNLRILNRNGQDIWSFYGIASTNPGSVPGSALDEFTTVSRRWNYTVPFQSESERYMAANIDIYAQYVAWLLEADLDGRSGKNYFTDYLAGKEPVHTRVYSATDSRHPAPVKVRAGPEPAPPNKAEPGILKMWRTAQSGKWGTFWEGEQVKASFLLFLICLGAVAVVLVLFGVLLALLQSSDSAEEFAGWVMSPLMLAALIATGTSIYYLLKAIF